MKTLCYYSVARFIPDLLRNEPKNIGILFYSEQDNYFGSRFISANSNKLGSSVQKPDHEIIAHYSKYFKQKDISTKDDLLKITDIHDGKIQFSELKAVVTDNLDNEFDYLYNTFVSEKSTSPGRRLLKTSVKRELESLNLIGQRKLHANARVSATKSHLEHTVDFAYTKGKQLLLIDAVDLTVNDKRDAYKTAFKFKDLTIGRKKDVETYSVVKTSNGNNVKEFLDVLNATSIVINFANGQKAAFLDKLKKVIK